MAGAPKGYTAAAFAADVAIFRKFIKETSPGTIFLGPGSAAEGGVIDQAATLPGRLRTEDLMKATGSVFDVFSYHLYPGVSNRCAAGAPGIGTSAAAALSSEWLSRPEKVHDYYAGLRDRYAPGKPIWVTETADAACGGNPWASTFLDSFRYLHQHGLLAQKGVQVIAHNTLSASDYGMLDEETFDPRPNYWAALLWRRLMGATVLNPGSSAAKDLYVYAHCMRDRRGGVTVLAINAAKSPRTLDVQNPGESYALTAKDLESTAVQLNSRQLQVSADGSLPAIAGAPVRAGRVELAPASITFLSFPQARNSACQ
jgi:hypothetical protein